MLNLKSKRPASSSRVPSTPPATPPEAPAAADGAVSVTVRELLTREAIPKAPPLEYLFAREGSMPSSCIVFWEPARNWPLFSISQVATGPRPKVTETRLRQEQASQVLAQIQHTRLPTPDGQDLGIVRIKAALTDPMGAAVALTLLEQADRAVVLAGGSGDRELVRRIQEHFERSPWDGPSMLMLTPADKPQRAERLRKAAWPNALRVHVLETFASPAPDWPLQLVSMVTGADLSGTNTRDELRGVPPAADPDAAPVEGGDSLWPQDVASDATALSAEMPLALDLTAAAPGVLACAIVDRRRRAVLGSRGEDGRIKPVLGDLVALWKLHDRRREQEPLSELSFVRGEQHCIALPVPGQAELLLMVVASTSFGDPALVRWQMKVALNHFDT
ncbi:hypothetical protein C7444_103291 [Sphaerotilus hippei]|uniref:Uncharacterized protein n=1 Tax=Sphaerotilus hippei TaxID=744406 RepID=A0A318HEM1_9BURK|nr:hypothetical protein [Sphaerotilus hippei]PXW98193.1 hypothetical protein C7444_103291 [Sphaerotilus hippei]